MFLFKKLESNSAPFHSFGRIFIVFLTFTILLLGTENVFSQETEPTDTAEKKTLMTKFNTFNKKAEKAFKYLPFPMVTYATETGTVFGLVKYNIVRLVKADTISTPSSFSELISFSTKGQFKVVLGSTMNFMEDQLLIKIEFQYVDYPDLILGVGNDVVRENVEEIRTKRIVFQNEGYVSFDKKRDFYFGALFNYTNYMDIEFEENSFFTTNEYPGYLGGISSGLGLGLIFDKRDHRYNASKGTYIGANIINYDGLMGSYYNFYDYEIDIRQYWNPWYEHVIAAQVFTRGSVGDVPFYSLSLLGGTERMRGYYLGAIRDKIILDAQVEYRMPVWNIFGIVAFAGAGRVAPVWNEMNMDDLWYSGGLGLRIMVDRTNKANLRIDFGYGQKGAKTLTLGFTEAF